MAINGCIETMHFKNGKVTRLHSHIKRLRKSMKYITGDRLEVQQFQEDLLIFIQTIEDNESVIRVQYNQKEPQFIFSKRSIPSRLKIPTVGLLLSPIIPICDHSWIKNSDRTLYETAINDAIAKGWDDAILINENGKVAESTISNIILKKNNIYYTPSLDQGCVAGIYRQLFITTNKFKNSKVIEKPISIEEVKSADEVFLCNAIRGLYPIELINSENENPNEKLFSTQSQLRFD